MINKSEFRNKYLDKIKNVLEFSVNNQFSDFYKNKYANLGFDVTGIESLEDFLKIPPLTKEELLNTPIEKRTLVSKKMIGHYTTTSGTTNAGNPLILPHTYFKQENIPSYKNFDEDMLESMGIKNFLVLRPSDSPIYTLLMSEKKSKTKAIGGDVRDICQTAKNFNNTKIDGIVTTPTLLYLLEKELELIRISTENIKWIWLAGELLTTNKLEFFKKKFPNAWIEVKYGSTENLSGLTPRGYQCRKRDFPSNLYHIYPAFYLEILDGEILQTDLFNKAFPLIRYKTGDYGKIFSEKCACGNNDFLELGGRDNLDVVRAEGMIIYAEVIERAIFMASDYIEPEWQAHLYERNDKDLFCLEIIIDLVGKKDLVMNSITKSNITKILEENIFLAKGKPLRWFIENGKALPLKIRFKDKILKSNEKAKNIISHIK